MYTKTNMLKTMDNAEKLLRDGYISGQWQCHVARAPFVAEDGTDYGPGDLVEYNDHVKEGRALGCLEQGCCAEGAIELATGITHEERNREAGKYASHIIGRINDMISNGNYKAIELIDANDGFGLGYVVRIFNEFKKTLKESK